jgi:hypothetical protein
MMEKYDEDTAQEGIGHGKTKTLVHTYLMASYLLLIIFQQNNYSQGAANIDCQGVRNNKELVSREVLNFDEIPALNPGVGISAINLAVLHGQKNSLSSLVLKCKMLKLHPNYQRAFAEPSFVAYDIKMTQLKGILEDKISTISQGGTKKSLQECVVAFPHLQPTLTKYKQTKGSCSTALGRIH